MRELMVEVLAPRPFVHHVVPRRWFSGYSCLCGWRGEVMDHPHATVTRSRTDWTPIPHPANG